MSARRLEVVMILATAFASQVYPAVADGLPSRPPDPYAYVAPSEALLQYNWTGLYFGGALGVATSREEWSALGLTDVDRVDGSGFAGGGFIGLQKQWSWLVLGAEVEYLWAGTSGTANLGANSVLPPFVNTSFKANLHDLILVTGKFGWNWENILAYFKGGWASGDVTYQTTGSVITSAGGRENGWTAGVGVEYALWPHVIVGVEYDYVAPLSAGATTQVATAAGPLLISVSSRADIQAVTARLSFKFGGRP